MQELYASGRAKSSGRAGHDSPARPRTGLRTHGLLLGRRRHDFIRNGSARHAGQHAVRYARRYARRYATATGRDAWHALEAGALLDADLLDQEVLDAHVVALRAVMAVAEARQAPAPGHAEVRADFRVTIVGNLAHVRFGYAHLFRLATVGAAAMGRARVVNHSTRGRGR